MIRNAALLALAVALVSTGCEDQPTGLGITTTAPTTTTTAEGGAGGSEDTILPLDTARAQETFQTTTDLMRYVISPTCAAENNECHNNEDYPDMSTEGNFWNLRGLPCNVNVGERETIEDICEASGDQVLINGSFATTVGSIAIKSGPDGDFEKYELTVETPLPESYTGATFVIQRAGVDRPEFGSGTSFEGTAGGTIAAVTDADDIPDPKLVRQGDENMNGIFGTGTGVTVFPGDAHQSYIVRRLLQAETTRERMPLNGNADNPTEINGFLSPDEMYAMMSWINCMEPTDSTYSEIRYDCEANETNAGIW